MIHLSQRLPADLSDSPFFSELAKAKREVKDYIDLTVSSPLKTGLSFDLASAVEASKGKWDCWNPDSSGAIFAREAVARYYAERGGFFDAGHILLTASTSEAYSIIFKTLCEAGDSILTPLPGYPLLDALAGLEYLDTAPYFLKRCGDKWVLDEDSLYSFPERSRILLIVSPHNPTGHSISHKEWDLAVEFASENDLAIVVDEVFGDFIYDKSVERPWMWDSKDVPVFFLNGLSKTVGSPELKLGWMAYREGELKGELKRALEYVADAYLSVSSPAFALAPQMLAISKDYEQSIIDRAKRNLQVLRSAFPSKGIFPDVQGGWYAAIHFEGADDERLTLKLLRDAKVLVQPGFFFDFDEDGWIVLSLLLETDSFEKAVNGIHLTLD
ncbi:MAG: pyridoxal phosphate-dependent aminotransferase [Fibrobacteraceae bacterium]